MQSESNSINHTPLILILWTERLFIFAPLGQECPKISLGGDTAVFVIVRSIENLVENLNLSNLFFQIKFGTFKFPTEFSIDLTKTKIGSYEAHSGCSPVKGLRLCKTKNI